ncbi:BEN domain-containing protein 2 [Myotis myotis]|uniref:BEN domain-containing protein 2 n=1 Tax=Myotis myotis TaxID=51298 RepID=UPI001749764F|nr:BEN domain-containing protein 2 [Myotis myotis]
MMNNPQFLGNKKGGQDMPHVIILSNEGDKAWNNREENTQTMNNRHVLGNNYGAQVIPRILIFCDGKGGKAQNTWGKNTQTMNNKQMLGNNSGGRDIAHVLILCDDEMDKTQIKQKENTQMVNNPGVLGNNEGGQDTPRVLIHSHGNSTTEIKSETTIYPISVKNEIKQENIYSESHFITPGYGYLGDPKRNVTIHKVFLMNAQKKPEPKHAARYLVRNLFSREVLLCSIAVTSNSRRNPKNRQPLDPNIMAALREHLVTNFPNHDLHECGGEWKACISYVNSLLRYLRSAAQKKAQKTVVPTKRSTPASVDLDDERDADGDKGSFLLPKQEVASETNANGNSQPNSIAVPEGFEGPSTSASMAPYRELHYIGNPSRNVQVSYSVLMIAKRKACPQMSASYLIGQLFPEEVLLNSTIYGNLWQGVCALNYNMISALREFLQENYPRCDLSESGREWKMCVKSMNYYIRTLKHGYSNYTSESSSVSEMISSSSNSESSDTDLSD